MYSSILLIGVLALSVIQQVAALPAPNGDGERAVKRNDGTGRGSHDILAGLANLAGNDVAKNLENTGKSCAYHVIRPILLTFMQLSLTPASKEAIVNLNVLPMTIS